jgi:hypothetical protein
VTLGGLLYCAADKLCRKVLMLLMPLQAADVLAYEGNKRLRDVDRPTRRAWTAINPNSDRIRVRYYGKHNMNRLVLLLTRFRAKLVADGWDGKIVA